MIGLQQTAHTAEKLDRLSAECAAGLWRAGGEECRMEECASLARRIETWFPVCISCVFNVQLRARACFLCVMGARPRTPTQRQHAMRTHQCQWQARQLLHASGQFQRLLSIYTGSQWYKVYKI